MSRHSDERQKELHIAPMMSGTTREMRELMRILSRRMVLWTEMVADQTAIHASHLGHVLGHCTMAGDGSKEDDAQHPIVCQLGGCQGSRLFEATLLVQRYGDYDEVNLNCGCPSDRVTGKEEFGAVLMKKIEVAEAAIEAMVEAATALERSPRISIKCRVGVDDHDTVEHLTEFISRMTKHTKIFYLHARKAVLGGILTT
ncbi:MAG: tRNA-dihydrouridine synthase, partial [Bacteroidota bacterium]